MNTSSEPVILVALSGGVDSAVVLHLMKQRYHRVMGVSHRHWPESSCCATICIDNCRAQCADLGVPYLTADTLVSFTEKIVTPFCENYAEGKTPNPCIYCNVYNRFGAMPQELFDKYGDTIGNHYKIATGHYARIVAENGRYYLHRGIDKAKDQSYMLYRLSQAQLSRVLFPLGDYQKDRVRQMAESFKLKSAKTPDSQDICFTNGGDYRTFIADFSEKPDKSGHFFDTEGKDLGPHKGITHYSRGQRKGLGLGGGPWFVVDIDALSGNITLGKRSDLEIAEFEISNVIWHALNIPETFEAETQVRYHANPLPCKVLKGSDKVVIQLTKPNTEVTPGQHAVLYQGARVIGGGVIEKG